MRSLSGFHPAAQMIYFSAVIGTAMFCGDAAMYVISLIGSLSFFVSLTRGEKTPLHIYLLLLFLASSLINPLVSHKGMTVLFVMNDSPVTLEALLYGVFSGIMVVSVIYWFMCFTRVMTSDRLLYVFGFLSPKLSLVISMALRFVPLFSAQAAKVNAAQKALGLYKEDNVPDRIRGGARVFSVMATWALENGIITADSMEARGYGAGKRTHFSVYRFRPRDLVLSAVSVISAGIIIAGLVAGAAGYGFYPVIKAPEGAFTYTVYALFGALSLTPVFLEIAEGAKWRYLRSRI